MRGEVKSKTSEFLLRLDGLKLVDSILTRKYVSAYYGLWSLVPQASWRNSGCVAELRPHLAQLEAPDFSRSSP